MTPPTNAPTEPDIGDAVCAQAQMVAFAIPGAGPALAAFVSIFQAMYDKWGKIPVRQTYSVSVALDDLAQRIMFDLNQSKTDTTYNTIFSWQQLTKDLLRDTAHYATTNDLSVIPIRLGLFLDNPDVASVFTTLESAGPLTGSNPISRQSVEQLAAYGLARTTYHSWCLALLQYLAPSYGLIPETEWIKVPDLVHWRLRDSLQDAIDYMTPIVTMLTTAQGSIDAKATAVAKAAGGNAAAYNKAYTAEYRRLRLEAHLDAIAPDALTNASTLLTTYQTTLTGLDQSPLPILKGTPPAGAGLGARAPGTARFLFESGAQSWLDVVADSTVSAGAIATQNAGSNLPSIYYQVGGDSVNGTFHTDLVAASQLTAVNQALVAAYNTVDPSWNWAVDSAKSPPPTDRLTSVIIPLTPGTPPIGKSVYAMVYTVGPQLTAGITDTAGYKKLYTDAINAISNWNANTTAVIENFRITMVSTGAFGGPTAGAALYQQAAGLIIDAIVEALSADALQPVPRLQTLTILVNSNDYTGGIERVSFMKAADARTTTKAHVTMQGIDVPYQ